jgi:lipoprotein NlpI
MKKASVAALALAIGSSLSGSAQGPDENWARCAGGNADLAIGACTAIIQSGAETTHNLAVAFNNRGHAYDRKGDNDRAIQDFDQAIRLRPDYALAFFNRGVAYGDKKEYDQAIRDYDQAIRLKPDFAEAFGNRGRDYNIKGDHDRAIQDLNQALRLKPDFVDGYTGRAFAYAHKKDYDRAMQDFNQALRLNSGEAEAYVGRAGVYEERKDYIRAIQDYDQALRLKPDVLDISLLRAIDCSFLLDRGWTEFNQGEFSEASEDFHRLLELTPTDSDAALGAFVAEERTGKSDWAHLVADLEKQAQKLNQKDWPRPVIRFYLHSITQEAVLEAAKDSDAKRDSWQHYQAYFFLGEYALWHARRQEAAGFFQKAIVTGRDSGGARPRYAVAGTELKRLSAVVDHESDWNMCRYYIYNREYPPEVVPDIVAACTALIQSGKENTEWLARAFYFRGLAYTDMKDYGRAIQDCDQAIKLDPNSNHFEARAQAYADKNDYARAIQDYDQAIRLGPRVDRYVSGRGRVHFYQGQFSEANEDFRKALEIDPDQPYVAIASYLAQARAGKPGQSDLRGRTAKLDLSEWPGAVVKLYLGSITPNGVLLAAKDADADPDAELRCEAYFYLGEYALLHGQRLKAARLFRQAVATNSSISFEYLAAQSELRRLAVPGAISRADNRRETNTDRGARVDSLGNLWLTAPAISHGNITSGFRPLPWTD